MGHRAPPISPPCQNLKLEARAGIGRFRRDYRSRMPDFRSLPSVIPSYTPNTDLYSFGVRFGVRQTEDNRGFGLNRGRRRGCSLVLGISRRVRADRHAVLAKGAAGRCGGCADRGRLLVQLGYSQERFSARF